MRLGREDRIGRYIGAGPRFFLGLGMVLPHLLTENPGAKAVYVILFGLLALLSGKKIRLLYFLIFTGFMIVFHLLTPWGRVVMEIGGLTITEGSLRTGLGKALTLVGIVFLSLAIVRPELRLPGRIGRLVASCLCYFESMFEHRRELTRELGLQRWNIYAALDNFLLERFNLVEGTGDMRQIQQFPKRNRWISILVAAVVVSIPWAVWFRVGLKG